MAHYSNVSEQGSPARSPEDCPFDEPSEERDGGLPPVKKKNRHAYFQTAESMRALSQMEYADWSPSITTKVTTTSSLGRPLMPPMRGDGPPSQPRPWSWEAYTSFPRLGSPLPPTPQQLSLQSPPLSLFPSRTRPPSVYQDSPSSPSQMTNDRVSSLRLRPLPPSHPAMNRPYTSWTAPALVSPPPPPPPLYPMQFTTMTNDVLASSDHYIQTVGHPSLGIYKGRLPANLISSLQTLIDRSESAAALLDGQWKTNLYSLTKQDVPVRQIPGSKDIVGPIQDYILDLTKRLYRSPTVRMDKNQPHVLKYSAAENHTGVQLHHDRCDVTANLTLSSCAAYQGGGTYYPAVGDTLRLGQGEFVLHPGSLVHAGTEITAGTRHLLVFFCHLDKNQNQEHHHSMANK